MLSLAHFFRVEKGIAMTACHHLSFSIAAAIAATLGAGSLASGSTKPVPWSDTDTRRDFVSPAEIRDQFMSQRQPRREGALDLTFISNGQSPELDYPTNITFSPDGQKILISHWASENIGVYDANTRDLLRVVELSGGPYDLEVMPDGVHAVSVNLWENTVSFFNYISGNEVAVVPVGNMPSIPLVSPDGTYVAIANAMDQNWSIINTATYTVERTVTGGGVFDFGFAGGMGGVYTWTYKSVILPDNRLVLQDWTNQRVNFIDLATGQMQSVSVGGNGMMIAATPAGDKVLVLHNPAPDPVRLTIIDAATLTVDRVISHPFQSLYNGGTHLVVRPDGSKAAFFHGATATMIFDLVTPGATPMQSFVYGFALNTTSDGAYLFLNRSGCSSLIDWETGQPISFGGPPEFCAPPGLEHTGTEISASSPTDPRVAMIDMWSKENLVVFNLDGVNAHVEGIVPTGVANEADYCRNMAVTSDGTRAVGINEATQNATIFDLTSNTAIGWAEVGTEPVGVVITPDNTKALVTNITSNTITVIDLNDFSSTHVPTSGCTGPIVVDPNGQYAYFTNVVGSGESATGQVMRLNLKTLTVDPNVLNVAIAGTIYYRTIGLFLDLTWTKTAPLVISHDGATLLVAGTAVSLIDLASWQEVARLSLSGSVPEATDAVFSPDDSLIYLIHMDVWNNDQSFVNIISNAGASSQILNSVQVGRAAVDCVVNDAGTMLYVGCRGGGPANTKAVHVFDLAQHAVVSSIIMPSFNDSTYQRPADMHLSDDGSTLYTITSDGYLHAIDTASNTIIDSQDTGAFSACSADLVDGRLIIVSPYAWCDGLTIANLGGDAPAVPGDVTGDGVVNVDDLLAVIASWGSCPAPPAACDADIAPYPAGDGVVNVDDLLMVIANWG